MKMVLARGTLSILVRGRVRDHYIQYKLITIYDISRHEGNTKHCFVIIHCFSYSSGRRSLFLGRSKVYSHAGADPGGEVTPLQFFIYNTSKCNFSRVDLITNFLQRL